MTLYVHNISGSAPVALFTTQCCLGVLQACKVPLFLCCYMHPPVQQYQIISMHPVHKLPKDATAA